MIAFSDKNLSVGTMEIKPNKELAKHSRPVWESLYQIKGKCIIKLFKKDGLTKEIILNEGESIDIPPLKSHIHSNPFNQNSITFWRANGDITEIIDNIRKNSEM